MAAGPWTQISLSFPLEADEFNGEDPPAGCSSDVPWQLEVALLDHRSPMIECKFLPVSATFQNFRPFGSATVGHHPEVIDDRDGGGVGDGKVLLAHGGVDSRTSWVRGLNAPSMRWPL